MSESLFNSFFYRKAAEEPVQRVGVVYAAPEYAVLPQRLVYAYTAQQVPPTTVQRPDRQQAASIVHEMEELRKTRAESQQVASAAVLNYTIRAYKTQIDQLQNLVQDLLSAFKYVQNDLKDVKSYQAEFTQKYGKLSTDLAGKLDTIERKIGQAPAPYQVSFMQATPQQMSAPADAAFKPTQESAPQAAPSEEGQAFGQKPPPSFAFNQQKQPDTDKAATGTFYTLEYPKTQPPAQYQTAQQPSYPVQSQFNFNPPTEAAKPPAFNFGTYPAAAPPNSGFGTAYGGFGYTKPAAFTFGAYTADNPFAALFAKNQ